MSLHEETVQPPRAAGGEAPRDELEQALAGIFSSVLGLPVATRDADFVRLGGDSLLAWRAIVLCQKRLGLALSVNAVLAHPTVAGLAQVARAQAQPGASGNGLARVSRAEPQPLTPQQYALWLELKLRSDSDTYNEPIAFRVETHLAPERLRRALERLAARHEILRARLVEQAGEPRFVFDLAPAAVELELLEAAAFDARALLGRPFDLARGPLWRAALQHEGQGASVLLLVVHHIILDAASEEILLRDLAAALDEPEAALPAQPLDFCDLASHEAELLREQQGELERFWTETLAGAELTPALPPPCVPCPPGEDDRGCSVSRALEPALAGSIRARAASLGTTPFHFYLAAYLALLRTYSASDDLVVGSPVSLRETPAARDVVGYLLSPVALRVRLSGQSTFRQTVEEVARRWREVRAHARLPMHLVLHAARGGRSAEIGSPFQVFFSLIHDACEELTIDGQPLLPFHVPPVHAKFQLFLLVEERAQDASLTLEFQRGVLDPEMGARLLAQLERLLRAACAEVDAPLGRMPLLDTQALAELRAFGRNERPYDRDASLPDLFEELARRQPERAALVCGAEEVSYAQLDRRANSVAAALSKAGVLRGDRVPLLVPRGAGFVASALGVLKCGAAYVPLDPAYPPERLVRMLAGLGARVGLRSARVPLALDGIAWIDACCADEESHAAAPPRAPGAGDAAYVMFTSGSTGRPKGVEVPQRAIVRLVQAQDFVRMDAQQTWLHMAPTSFDASTLEIWAALLNGGRCVVIQEAMPAPAVLAETLRRGGVTSAWFTAALFNALVDEAPETLAGLSQILVGGEALSPAHVQRAHELLPGVRLVNGYGPTENTTFTCCHVIGPADLGAQRAIPIGRPIANTSVQILDRDGQPAPLGVPGELVAGGDGVALGYAGQPELTAERFRADSAHGERAGRLYSTGDRVRWRADGVIEFLGRFDDQVKIRGHRIEPGEVAACLEEHADVRRALVVPRRTAAGSTQLVAYVVARRAGPADGRAELLAAHAAQRLPAYMLPAAIQFVQHLPLKPNGKLDLEALERAPQPAAQPAQEAPLSATEAKVLTVWRSALDLPALGPDDDFFEFGGDSLLAIRMLVRVERELGTKISVRALVEGRTVRRITSMLASSLRSSLPRGVVRVREGDLQRPLFCLPGLGGVALQFGLLATKFRTNRTVYVVELHELDVEPRVLESLVDTAAAIVERMRAVQPAGKFSIWGYSYGGNLAVEVARELLRQGQEVELVVLLDAYAPGALRDPSGFAKIMQHVRILQRLRFKEAYGYLASRIVRRLLFRGPAPEPPPPPPTTELERRLAETEQRGLKAFHEHRPTPFAGRVVLVQATDLGDWMEIADPSGTCGWGAICEGGVEIIPIGCEHLQLFKEPHLSALARRLDQLLESARRA